MAGWFSGRIANRRIYIWKNGRITWLAGWIDGWMVDEFLPVWLARWRQVAVPCRLAFPTVQARDLSINLQAATSCSYSFE